MSGISNAGQAAERRFLDLVSNSKASPSGALGDAQVLVDGKVTYVEIKKCSGGATSRTINQVRPIKFIPMVVYSERMDRWWVVPATELVRLAISKERGQHTELAFESMNLNLNQLDGWRCSPYELEERVWEAIRLDRQNHAVGREMDTLLGTLKGLATTWRARVAGVLGSQQHADGAD